MVEPIVVDSGKYEARTDGSTVEVRRKNGVVIGQGRVGIVHGEFCVGDYTGEVDEQIYAAVQELLREHEGDIVLRWLASSQRGAQA